MARVDDEDGVIGVEDETHLDMQTVLILPMDEQHVVPALTRPAAVNDDVLELGRGEAATREEAARTSAGPSWQEGGSHAGEECREFNQRKAPK